MAKLLHPLPSSSRPPLPFPAQRHDHPRRRRPPARRKLPLSTPSTAVLAALATISAASSTVDGHPLDHQPPPPDFLCPSYPSDYIPAQTPPPSVSTSRRRNARRDFATPSVNSPSKRDSRPSVPLKYEQGEDGRWRKSSSYSLLGSSFCGVSVVCWSRCASPTHVFTRPPSVYPKTQTYPSSTTRYSPRSLPP